MSKLMMILMVCLVVGVASGQAYTEVDANEAYLKAAKKAALYKLNADTAYAYKARYTQCVIKKDWECAVKAAEALMAKAIIASGKSVILVNGVDINAIPDLKYIMIVGYRQRLFSQKLIVTVDYGQEFDWGEASVVEDNYGKRMKFNGMIDALNYFYENGWDFKDAYSVTLGDSNVYHFVLTHKL